MSTQKFGIHSHPPSSLLTSKSLVGKHVGVRISYGLLAKSCQFEMCDYESLSGGFSLAEKVARVAKDELESGREREDQKLKSSTICLPPPPAHFQCLHLFNSRKLCDYYNFRFLPIEKSFKNWQTHTHPLHTRSI